MYSLKRGTMECYHCEASQAKLKCADCDSEIFRFCSNQCGLEAHADHKVLCYDRNSVQQVQDRLYDAIDEMHDQGDINHALEVVGDLIEAHEDGDHNDVKDVMAEAHEIIQGHIETIGFELVQMTPEEREAKRKIRADKRAARNAERAAKLRERANKQGARKETLAQRRESRAQKRSARAAKRAAAARKRKARLEKRANRQAQRASRFDKRSEDAKNTKPGMGEKWNSWRQGKNDARAQKYEQGARSDLDQNSGDESSGM